MRKIFRLGKNEKQIIKWIGLGILILSSIVVPNLPLALKPFLREEGPKKFKKSLRKLKEKGVIYLSGEKIRLTKKGKNLLKNILSHEIVIKKPLNWDKKWRLVSYDIPDYKKKERDWFRFKLKNLGFSQIQESLWVLPYECEEEIAVLAQSLGIAPFVVFMRSDYLPRQKQWKKHFGMRN